MRYTRKYAKLEDYFEGEELERVRRELEEIKENDEEEVYYTIEEVIEGCKMEQEEKDKILREINEYSEKMNRKYIEKCRKVISNYCVKR